MKLSINIVTFGLIAAAIVSAAAQTPSFVPRTNNTGSIGTSDKQWGTGYFNKVYYDGEELSNWVSSVKITSFNTVTGAVELVAGDGIQIVTNGSQLTVQLLESPVSAIGTNRVYFRYTGYTNYWTVPAGYSNIAVWAWGGGGGTGGGFSYGTFSVTNNQIITIVVGESGQVASNLVSGTTNFWVSNIGFPNGGRSVVRRNPPFFYIQAYSGGGMSAVLVETNYYIVAGGGGGFGTSDSSNQESVGGMGGGITGGNGRSEQSGGTLQNSGAGGGATQTSGGSTPTMSSVVSLFWTNTSGSFLLGGDGGISTNAGNGVKSTGGGGGWYGGGGAAIFTSSGGFNDQNTGGGGSGYINPDYVKGVTLRGVANVNVYSAGTVPATEIPEYISGTGTGNGLIVIGY